MVKKKNNINVPIDLIKEEQEFVDVLTEKLIEIAKNPSMRKDFIIQPSASAQYRFFKEDIPSEIEHKALFMFNIANDNYERALLWAEQTNDELTKHHMLAMYYRYRALAAPINDDTQSLYLQALEHRSQSIYGANCQLLLGEYAEYLMKSGNEVNLIELAIMVFTVGLHRMNPADPDVLRTFSQEYTRDEVELIQKILQLIKDYADNGREEARSVFMDYYHWESAYYYACTARIEKAKQEIALFTNGDEDAKCIYDFNNLTNVERKKRHEELKNKIIEFIEEVLEPTPHINQMQLYALMAFGCAEPPKRSRPQKGSFDWLYNQAEKGYIASLKDKATEQDYQYMQALADAYRNGNGVRQNMRLADCWEKMAKHLQ